MSDEAQKRLVTVLTVAAGLSRQPRNLFVEEVSERSGVKDGVEEAVLLRSVRTVSFSSLRFSCDA